MGCSSSEEEIETLDMNIENALAKINGQDTVIITGHWNAKVGGNNTDWKLVMGRYGYSERNEREDHFLEFATGYNLYVCNMIFRQKPSRKWT